ncbi:LysR family transcriptional regulator [Pseudonocardia sp. HH130630-07]|uniref:LysR family transcriptional regulator n=1 Tax=Pseudonocardia sp. HH130630-07 TaxID=1690815 RepID=UPI000814FD98|nr:LysR family transcriptional regulator [Pseudonocardia sp. HH130630-07]ANY09271.1 hypothetical protein AFB00_26895 [Pseudonocardia sp. HH130630-07]
MSAPARVPDLTALALLVAVARTGTLGSAAQRVGLSPQAASARLRTLEQQVGSRVLERGKRGRSGRLTARGALLVEWAGPVLDAASGLDAAVAALRPAPAGDATVLLAAEPGVAEAILPGWLVELRDGPGGHVSLVDTPDPAAAVRAGTAAVGIVEGSGPLGGLHAATVAGDPLVLVVPPTHPWTRNGGVHATELRATSLLVRGPGAASRRAADSALTLAAPDVEPARPVGELAADAAVRAAVREGDGPAVLGRAAVAADVASGALVEVAVHGADLTREFRAVWLEGTSPQGTARDLLRIATGGRIR